MPNLPLDVAGTAFQQAVWQELMRIPPGETRTYAQIAANPALHRARTEADRTHVILDEVHHGGDALSWGDAVREAFESATRRLMLTGTPFRSDTAKIPFVRYERGNDGIRRSSADYTYGYAEALADHDPPVLAATIGQRIAFAAAAQSGCLVSELDDDTPAAREIAALADAIDGLGIGRATR